jgi:hypothetical protein
MDRRVAVIAAAVAGCAFVAACGGPAGPRVAPSGVTPSSAAPSSAAPSAAATPAPRSTPTAPSFAEARSLPAPAAAWNPVRQPDGSFVVGAVSAPQVEIGILYRYAIGTHCGITATTFDVGGSFWDPVGDPTTFRLAEPEDGGVFVLLGADEAIWTSTTGFQVRLVRGEPGPRQVFFCD